MWAPKKAQLIRRRRFFRGPALIRGNTLNGNQYTQKLLFNLNIYLMRNFLGIFLFFIILFFFVLLVIFFVSLYIDLDGPGKFFFSLFFFNFILKLVMFLSYLNSRKTYLFKVVVLYCVKFVWWKKVQVKKKNNCNSCICI